MRSWPWNYSGRSLCRYSTTRRSAIKPHVLLLPQQVLGSDRWKEKPLWGDAPWICRWWSTLLGLVQRLLAIQGAALPRALLYYLRQLGVQDYLTFNDETLWLLVQARRGPIKLRQHVLDGVHQLWRGHPTGILLVAARLRESASYAGWVWQFLARVVSRSGNHSRCHANAHDPHSSFLEPWLLADGSLWPLLGQRMHLRWKEDQATCAGRLWRQEHGCWVHVWVPLLQHSDRASSRIPLFRWLAYPVSGRRHLLLHHLLDGQVLTLSLLSQAGTVRQLLG